MRHPLLRRRAGMAVLSTLIMGLGGFTALGATAAPKAFAVAGDPANTFSCRASVLRVESPSTVGTVEPLVANDADTPCKTEDNSVLPVTTIGPVSAAVLNADTEDVEHNPAQPGDHARALADVAGVEVLVPGLDIKAAVLAAEAHSVDCDAAGTNPELVGGATVLSLNINGNPITIPPSKSTPTTPTIPLPGLGNIFLNEEITGNNSLTERAVNIELNLPVLGVLNVVVAEAQVDKTGNPCAPPPPPACPPPNTTGPGGTPCCPRDGQAAGCCADGSAPPCPVAQCPNEHEKDPFVDPTAASTKGLHPDCAPFDTPHAPNGGKADGEDYVHFVRSINDADTSPDGAFTAKTTADSRDRFDGDAGFIKDGDKKLTLDGKFFDDEDMNFRLAPKTIDAYKAPNGLAMSPWRRFCGTGVVSQFMDDEGNPTGSPKAPFKLKEVRKFMVETFDADALDRANPGGDQSDYWVIDIYKSGSNFDTKQCDPNVGGEDHNSSSPNFSTLDYHSEGQTIAGNIEIHSTRRNPPLHAG